MFKQISFSTRYRTPFYSAARNLRNGQTQSGQYRCIFEEETQDDGVFDSQSHWNGSKESDYSSQQYR